jgi:hypothetical protein
MYRSGHGITWSITEIFSWVDWRKPQETTERTVRWPAEIWSHIPNTKKKKKKNAKFSIIRKDKGFTAELWEVFEEFNNFKFHDVSLKSAAITWNRTSQLHREGLCDGKVKSVCQWSYDQSPVQSHVLIAVVETPCKTCITLIITHTQNTIRPVYNGISRHLNILPYNRYDKEEGTLVLLLRNVYEYCEMRICKLDTL